MIGMYINRVSASVSHVLPETCSYKVEIKSIVIVFALKHVATGLMNNIPYSHYHFIGKLYVPIGLFNTLI